MNYLRKAVIYEQKVIEWNVTKVEENIGQNENFIMQTYLNWIKECGIQLTINWNEKVLLISLGNERTKEVKYPIYNDGIV